MTTKEFNEMLGPLLHKYKYPCFHRAINKIVFGKHYKGIRKTATPDQIADILITYETCRSLIMTGYNEEELLTTLKNHKQND